MALIRKIQYARIAGVSRPAVTKGVKNGIIVEDENGMIDIEHPVNKYYIACKGIITSDFEVEKMMKSKPTSEKRNKKQPITAISKEQLAEFIARKKKADAEHAELKNQKLRGELLDSILVRDMLFLFLDSVANNLQRNAGAYLSDVAHRIVNEGGLNSSIRNQWSNLVMEQFDNAKKEIIKRVDQIKVKQNG